MDSFNWDLLSDLMGLYTGVGILLIILLGVALIYIVYRCLMNLYEDNEKLNKKIRIQEIKEVIKEIKKDEEK